MTYKKPRFIIYVFIVLLSACGSVSTKTEKHKNILPKDENLIEIPELANAHKTYFKDSDAETKWVDSIYSNMSLNERVGQLFMVSAFSNKDEAHIKQIKKLVQNGVGGLIFFQGGPMRQANLTNAYQSLSKIPLFIGIDAEWGLSMRLDSTARYPMNITLGAIDDLKLIENLGKSMAADCKRMGIHFNFAPVLDINSNPKNPIIGFRSFGENKKNVTQKAIALMKGIQQEGILATGKHFPGHGNTETDSHKSLPLITASKIEIDSLELYPFKKMFQEGLASVMVAHLNIPNLEPKENLPSSLSYNITTKLLQNKLAFEGLIFTDALDMKGVKNYKKTDTVGSNTSSVVLDAFLSGNDILLCADNVAKEIETICKAYEDGIFNDARLDKSVKKILRYKYKVGLHHYKPIATKNLIADLNPVSKTDLQYQLYENALTVLQNKDATLPIVNLNQKIAYVSLGDDNSNAFLETLQKYTQVDKVSHPNLDSLNVLLKQYDTVILGYHKSDKAWTKQDFSQTDLDWIKSICQNNKTIFTLFAKPYTLQSITDFNAIKAIIVGYQNNPIAQITAAELIFGAIDSKGKLPVYINVDFPEGMGLMVKNCNRLGFSTPENMGMNGLVLSKIDSIASKTIADKMAPGMQILIARKGKVIFQKSYGFYTYDKIDKVTPNTLYDIASVTKIIATLPNIMQFYNQGKLNLNTTLGTMLPFLAQTNKSQIQFQNLLSHNAGLQAWEPFYKATLNEFNKPSQKFYAKLPNDLYSIKVADSLYITNKYHEFVLNTIANSPVSDKKEYKYSDFAFMLLKEFLEQETKTKLDVLCQENFFKPLGMNNTLFNPLQKRDKNKIAPTDIDTYFRYQTIQGYVHDMAAAMEGGVAGHAGLFSNAMDLAKMMQLYLQKGKYGGKSYFSEATMRAFNNCHFCKENIRRGLGFDKPELGKKVLPAFSEESFGHTGFTGTMVWVDPKSDIIFIFLSNRTYPDSNAPNRLSSEKIREKIQKIIHEAIKD
jgi:beta-N-acetylhexosaminidase